ncbi:hypothetical protein PHMEG_0009462 [Phytophthora megakarya]|uniref:Uncharacterized protein n=1 Tax=Phytophthora megakarya TaxID=4795 RepID=A0A225WH22_9STRA|nr:hypothetical protein PHMEG_0009462 [Phytophthora megakarya]
MPLSSIVKLKQLRDEQPADHAEFLQVLQAQLLETNKADFVNENSPRPSPSRQAFRIPEEHKLSEFPEWFQIREVFRKRPQHQCKTFSIRNTRVESVALLDSTAKPVVMGTSAFTCAIVSDRCITRTTISLATKYGT